MVIEVGSVIDGLVFFALVLSEGAVLVLYSWLGIVDRLVINGSWLDLISCGLIKASIIISLIVN